MEARKKNALTEQTQANVQAIRGIGQKHASTGWQEDFKTMMEHNQNAYKVVVEMEYPHGKTKKD